MATPWKIRRTVDLEQPKQTTERLGILAFTGANRAHELIITVQAKGRPVTLGSTTRILAHFLRSGEEIIVPGKTTENISVIRFPEAAYAIATRVSVLVSAEDKDAKIPLYAAVFEPGVGTENVIIDPEGILPTVSDLLAQIAAMEAATAAANNATGNANAAAQRATDAASTAAEATGDANAAAQRATDAAAGAQSWADATATAQTLAPGSAATVSVTTGTGGKKQFVYGIPRGDTGAQGPQGEKGDKGDPGKNGTARAR